MYTILAKNSIQIFIRFLTNLHLSNLKFKPEFLSLFKIVSNQ